MISAILKILGDPADVRAIVAVVAGVLVTIFHGAGGSTVVAIVDGVAGIIIAVDVALIRQKGTTPTPPSA